MPDWDDREGQLLRAIADSEDRGVRPDFEVLVSETGLEARQAEFGVQSLLDAGMITGLNTSSHDGFDYAELRLLPSGRQALGIWLTQLPPDTSADQVGMELFISHSSRDADLAEALIELLRSALSIPAEQVRCTSVDGYRLPGGAPTSDQLRQEIFGAKTLVGLLSPASLASSFVLFELGVRWGAGKHLLPLLVRGVVPTELPGPIADVNALTGTNRAQVLQLVSDIGSQLDRESAPPAVYQGHVERVIALARPGHQGTTEALSEPELARRRALLSRLRQEYLLSHDGLSPAMLAGTEPIPREWAERRLEELGEAWRQEHYW